MHKANNFDFLRLLFASFVIISHAYPLSGVKECDLLCQVSDGKLSFSGIGVNGFFIISGYLIFQSLERSKGLIDYFWKRLLRLFPALFVVLTATVLLAPVVYNDPLPYLKNKAVYTYIPRNLSLYNVQFGIKGVFENNPEKSAINGSLWTIPYEFTMYILLSFLYFFNNKRVIKFLLLVTFLLLVSINVFFASYLGKYYFHISSKFIFYLGAFFAAGSLLAAVNFEKIKYIKIITISSAAILILSCLFHASIAVTEFFIDPLLIIGFGSSSAPVIKNIGKKIGDLSYGVYIYGFPVQQTLAYYFKFGHIQLMAYGLIISYILAYFSWHLVEARALKHKNIYVLLPSLAGT